MTKSLTKVWLGGMKRMLSPAAKRSARDAQRITRDALEAAASAAVSDLSPPRESRVRPRAAWAAGEWTRGEHPMAPRSAPRPESRVRPLRAAWRRRGAMPLVVMLHGCQQSVDEFAQGTRMNLLADKHGFAVLYPEQSLRAHAHGCWHWYEDTDRAGRGEVNAVASLVDALVDEHGFDASRVYVAGCRPARVSRRFLHCTIRIVSRRWRCIRPGARRGDFGHYGDGRDAARRAPEPGGGRRRAGRCRRVSGHAGAGRPGRR